MGNDNVITFWNLFGMSIFSLPSYILNIKTLKPVRMRQGNRGEKKDP